MIINGSSIKLEKEDRKMINEFFTKNSEFIDNNSFYEYENIKKFGDLYEQYLDENNLSDNDILKLFLAEIRYDQLAYKITDNTARMKVEKMVVPKNRLNETISKWYHESNVYEYVSMSSVNKSLEMKLKQNALERQRSIDEADNFIVR
ncbi:MAG: hypothetical protein J5970_00235 [Bacilli bacterium]|nr:hypothetical protein [Bacilli bacterium]